MGLRGGGILATLALGVCALCAGATPEDRAIAYLAREVASWHEQNQCFSCHNNGDGARALYRARELSYNVPATALAPTSQWLGAPDEWKENRGDPNASDKVLAAIQFAAALGDGVATGEIAQDGSLAIAAAEVAGYQLEDGSWPSDAGGSVGSPVTYGKGLAVYMARRTLERAGRDRFRDAIVRADQWLLGAPPRNVPDAAATVLALHDRESQQAQAKVAEAVKLLRDAQSSNGGWGPYRNAPAEAFDTAIALLGLACVSPAPAELLRKGRAFLLREQLAGGGWAETTRPSGAQSYAQHVSTTAWALLALLAVGP